MLPGVPSRTNGTNNVNKSKRLQVPVCQGPGRVCRMITHQDHLNSFKSANYDFGAFGLATQSEPGDARFFGPLHDQKAVHQCTSAATCTYTTLHSHSLPFNSLHITKDKMQAQRSFNIFKVPNMDTTSRKGWFARWVKRWVLWFLPQSKQHATQDVWACTPDPSLQRYLTAKTQTVSCSFFGRSFLRAN